MKLNKLLTLCALALCTTSASAQTVNVPFSTNAVGKSLPINWGMDTAGEGDNTVLRGILHYGTNFTTGRISFQPVDVVNEADIDNAAKNFGLSSRQVARLNHRIARIKETGTKSVTINCDNEVLSVHVKDDGFCDGTEDFTGRNNYMSGASSANTATRWKNLIKATVKYAQSKGLTVLSVAPFNEPDQGTWQYYNAKAGWPTEADQETYGMRDFLAIAKAIKEDDFFKTGAGKDVRVCGGNTLNCDRALPWYNYCKDYLDEGNTHQLAGEFDTYAGFFEQVRKDNKVATADELHNVGEAMVGVQYGMQNAIWWHFDSKARGQFMHDSNEGVRLGYAEDRSHWTSAAVYRNDKDGETHGFIGSSERQANVSTYNFQCQDREVYFNGYGPQKEWSVTTVGGADKSYQNGQINYEYLFDITYGEDVQSAPVNGNYQLMNASNGMLATYMGENSDIACKAQANNNTQQWHIYADNVRNTGDVSYWFIDNVGVSTQHFNLRNGALAPGAKIMTYNANHDPLEQWYLRYAKDGYFYIISRRSNAYMYCNGESISLQPAPTASTSASQLKKYMWRLMPTDATAEQTAPAIPEGLTEVAVTSASVNFSWSAVTGESKVVTYNVLRQDANGWNTIARLQSGTTYTDAKVESGKGYRYKVQALDYSGNRSEMSEAITVIVPEEEGGETPTFTEGQWQWIGEAVGAGKNYYIYNIGIKEFLAANNTSTSNAVNDFTFNTNESNYNIQCSDGKYIRIYYTGSWSKTYFAVTNYSSAVPTTLESSSSNNAAGTVYRLRSFQANSYRFYCTSSSNFKATSTYNEYNGDNAKFLLISSTQLNKYALLSKYSTAFNSAKNYLTADLSSELMVELTSTLDNCDGTINYNNIETYITNLNTVIDKCKTYVDEHPAQPRTDFTGLIINPSIIQNGTTNDAPNGWKGATTNVTGNGHWTEGMGDTRLEAWHWTGDLNAEYYQDVILPNGLYTLTAVTHQREDGNAALYGETYKSFETKMPVGDGNEAQTDVTQILVTDGVLRIGMKVSDSGNWATADNFTLTRVSTPENTDLSHYTDAIAYLDELANEELLRYVDHEELADARTAAHNCEAKASAYETAINNYVAALKRAQAMKEQEAPAVSIGADMTGYIVNPTIQQNGGTNDAPNGWTAGVNVTGNGHYTEGTGDTRLEAWHWAADLNIDYYQTIENLPNGEYKLTAVTHQRENGNACLYAKAGTNEYSTKMPVGDGNEAVTTVNNITVTDGTLQIGMKASGAGNWVTADNFKLTYLGFKHNANLSCNAGKYGTFVAPYDVTLPEGITAYRVGSVNGSTVNLAVEANGGETLSANTPVIIYNNTSAKITENYSGTVTSVKDVVVGALTGFLESGRIIPYDAYVLQTQNDHQAFYKVGTTFHGTANRCYLNKEAASGDANVKSFTFAFGDETPVEVVTTDNGQQTTEVYDLSGRKVMGQSTGRVPLKKGIYIMNGRKVLVK